MAKIKQLRFFKQPNYFKATKEELNTLLSNKSLKIIIQLIFVLLTLGTISIVVFWNKIPPQIPLFYNRPRGQQQLADKIIFPLLPLSNLVLVLINLRLASFYIRKELLLSQILVWTTLIITLLNFINTINILIIVI
jgi:hypothetical protein